MVVGLYVILRSEVCVDSSFLSDIADRPKRFAYCDMTCYCSVVVCLFVCLSRSCIVLKQQKIST